MSIANSTDAHLFHRAGGIVLSSKTIATACPAMANLLMIRSRQQNTTKYCARAVDITQQSFLSWALSEHEPMTKIDRLDIHLEIIPHRSHNKIKHGRIIMIWLQKLAPIYFLSIFPINEKYRNACDFFAPGFYCFFLVYIMRMMDTFPTYNTHYTHMHWTQFI